MSTITGSGPIGVYEVMYYAVRGERVERVAGYDRALPVDHEAA